MDATVQLTTSPGSSVNEKDKDGLNNVVSFCDLVMAITVFAMFFSIHVGREGGCVFRRGIDSECEV